MIGKAQFKEQLIERILRCDRHVKVVGCGGHCNIIIEVQRPELLPQLDAQTLYLHPVPALLLMERERACDTFPAPTGLMQVLPGHRPALRPTGRLSFS